MASFIYQAFWDHINAADIDIAADTFYAMLTTSGYTPDKDAHDYRDDITNEVSGTGYSAGGVAVTMTPTRDDVEDQQLWTFSETTISTVTITGIRQVVYYKSRGGAASADELVAVADLGADIDRTSQDFVIPSAAIVIQN